MPTSAPRILTDETRRQLRHVVADPDVRSLELFPDFLIIGPQRTGSTWLHRNLIRHPQIFMTEPKEIYYFSSVQWPDYHPAHLPPIRPELSWYLRFFEEPDTRRAARAAQCRSEFGAAYDPKVRGEASATYAVACHSEVIDDILLLNPEVKIIMLVRHPTERAWSHLKKQVCMDEGRAVESIDREDCERFFGNEYQVDCSRFSRIIDKWSAKIPERNFFVGDFRDIRANPGDLLQRLFGFLGVDDDARWVGSLADVKICYTAPTPLPPSVRPMFEEAYEDELRRLVGYGFRW